MVLLEINIKKSAAVKIRKNRWAGERDSANPQELFIPLREPTPLAV
jgi:hypothetical protein